MEEHKNKNDIIHIKTHINGRHKSCHLSTYVKCKCIKHSKQKVEETSRMDLRSNTTIKTRPDYMLSTSDRL